MPFGKKVFWSCLLFVAGAASVIAGFDARLFTLCSVVLFLTALLWAVNGEKRWGVAGLFGGMLLLGGVYAYFYALITVDRFDPVFGQERVIQGSVASYPRQTDKTLGFILKTKEGYRIFVRLGLPLSVSYGDDISVRGTLKPLEKSENYLLRDRARGIVLFPLLEKREPGPWRPTTVLFRIREAFVDIHRRLLSTDAAALASGLILGQESAYFSNSFKDAMKNSGTTHLVALSGYNVSIFIIILFPFFAIFMRRRPALWMVVGLIGLFVILTGAESSVVRAALMGGMMVVAQLFSRIYQFGHSVALVGFLMAILNPFSLVYDIGLWLSFLALMGIVYGSSLVNGFIHFSSEKMEAVVHAVVQTVCAQAAVLPVLAGAFGKVSLVSVIANVPILLLVEPLMLFSFILGVVGFLAFPVAHLFSFIFSWLFTIPVGIIRFFGSFPVAETHFGLIGSGLYYALLGLGMWYGYRKLKEYEYRA